MKTFEKESKENAWNDAHHHCDYHGLNDDVIIEFEHEDSNFIENITVLEAKFYTKNPIRHTKRWRLIPQTNIETPEEKEALDLIDTTPQQYESVASREVEWDGKGLPPVGCKIKTRHGVSEVLSTSSWDGGVVTYSYDDGVSIGCAWNNRSWVNIIETPQQREERERLEAAYDLYCHAIDLDTPFDNFCNFGPLKDIYTKIVDKTGYKKEG